MLEPLVSWESSMYFLKEMTIKHKHNEINPLVNHHM